MNSEILFIEKQKFNQWWLWLLLGAFDGLFLYRIYIQVISGQNYENNQMNDMALLIATALVFALSILFLIVRLDTVIKKDGIYVRFFPFHLKFKHYSWDKLQKSYIREYSPITEYGGWGMKNRFSGNNNMAYNTSGNMGLQLEFIDNKKILIGTNKANELSEALKKIGQLKQ